MYSADGANHLGDLVVTKTHLIWCKGKTDRKNGVKVKWEEFIETMQKKQKNEQKNKK